MSPDFEEFAPGYADAFKRINESQPGLPAFLGLRIDRIEPGRLVASIEAKEAFRNPFGTMHGGIIAGLVDHVLAAVLYPVIPRGSWAASTEFKLNYLAPVRSGTVSAEATVISMTKRTAVVRVEVSNEGRAVCAAQGTVLIHEPKPA
ncbi:MAG: PaaI family thioesterase [Actinomycetota bacterium]